MIIEGMAIVNEGCTACGACVDLCPVEAISLDLDEIPTDETDEYCDVWVWLETRDNRLEGVGLELLGIGRELADIKQEKLVGILLGSKLEGLAEKAISHGADRVWCITDPALEHYENGAYTAALTELINQEKPAIVLLGATPDGRDLAPRVAARLQTGLTADCTGLAIELETGNLLQTRPAFGGNIMATIITPHHRPQMATVRPQIMKARPADAARTGEILDYPFESGAWALTRILSQEDTQKQVDLEQADIIVAGGRGADGPEGLQLLRELATTLGGTLAVSRAPVEEGWIAPDYQVGQTGKTVAPRLYIACGISGTIQHLVGIQGADIVVAINRDPKAPIFQAADYGLVGDLFEIVPLLITKIREIQKQRHQR